MGRHLNEREVGFDASTIGFPNIGDCMGVVLQTQNGLYGFHAMPGDAARVAELPRSSRTTGFTVMQCICMAVASGRNGAAGVWRNGVRR